MNKIKKLAEDAYLVLVFGAVYIYDRVENRLTGNKRPPWTWGGTGVRRY